jgi:uncharacterized protein (TIGR02266 family)
MSLTRPTAFNRRTSVRVHVDLQVRISRGKQHLYTFAVDLSQGGMFIHELLPYEAGTELELSFLLPGSSDPIECLAMVVQARETLREGIAGAAIGNGVKFLDLSPAAAERIGTFLRDRIHE